MKNFSFCVLAFIFLFSTELDAQRSVPTVLSKPTKYLENPDGDLVEGRAQTSRYLWVVYSDRADNKVYETPSEGSPKGAINFLDKFYVTGESGDFLELYKYENDIKIAGTGNKVQLNPNKAVRVGWIKKSYLLLWDRCLIDKTTHFAQKAMAVIATKNLDAELRKDNSLKIFNSPDRDNETKSTIKMFNFLYVYKQEGSRVLISKVVKTNMIRADRDILGWVDLKFLESWPDRVCLVPNTDADAVSSRKSADVKASLFYDKDEVIAWKEGKGSKAEPCWDKDTYEKPWIPSQQRFPIFKTENIDIVKTGFTTDLYKEGTNIQIMKSTDVDIAEQKLNETVKKIRNINIVFVVDAGFGMHNYSSAISASLKQLVNKRNELNKVGESHNNYKYGAVVYRSDEDKVCADGSNLSLNKISLRANATDVTNFLTDEFKNEGCSNDQLHKNVNGALLEALNMIKDANKDAIQSNYIFFLGGATGNKEAEKETIPSLIAKYDVSVSVFQVQSIADPVEFENFPSQFSDILAIATKKKSLLTDQRFRQDIKFYTTPGAQNLFYLDFPKTSPVQGNVNFPDKGQNIPASVIDDILDQTIMDYENTLENAIDKYKAVVTGIANQKTEGQLNAVVKNLLNRLGKDMNDYALAQKFNGQNVQFFIPAWTTANVNKVDRPVFKYVLYVEEEELTDMLKSFGDLIPDAPPSELREMMYDAYQSLAVTYFGKDILSDDKFKSKLSIDDIISKITGLPSSSQLLHEVKIADIKDVSKVSENTIDEIRKRISNSYEALQSAKKDLNGTVRFPTDDGTFYWILQDLLP